MSDVTRDFGLQMQEGVRDAHNWKWGPFFVTRTTTPGATCYMVGVMTPVLVLQITLGIP